MLLIACLPAGKAPYFAIAQYGLFFALFRRCLNTGYFRPISALPQYGLFSPYFAIAQYGLRALAMRKRNLLRIRLRGMPAADRPRDAGADFSAKRNFRNLEHFAGDIDPFGAFRNTRFASRAFVGLAQLGDCFIVCRPKRFLVKRIAARR